MAALEARHLASLTFPEVSRALRALSSAYVERRGKLAEGAALDGAGKRAAFALYYGPLHFLLVQAVASALNASSGASPSLVDLGCGTGAAGAAWAASHERPPQVIGIDRNAWALGEADWTYRQFGLRGRTRQGDATKAALPSGPLDVLAAFTLNELPDAARSTLLDQLIERTSRGGRLLILEPLAKGITPWWGAARERILTAGGRDDEWRFRLPLPPIVTKLDRAIRLNHTELRGKSLFLAVATRD